MKARDIFVQPKLCDKAERDWLYRAAAVPPQGGFSVNGGLAYISVKVYAGNALYCVYRRKAVSAAAFCRFRSLAHVGHIRRKFCQDRNGASFFCRRCEPFHKLRNLANVAAQAFFRHVGAGKIQLDGVGSSVLAFFGKRSPFLFVLPHD